MENQLQSLNISDLKNLYKFDCGYNKLQTLNASGLTNLYYLYCDNNQISDLNLTGLSNLHSLGCFKNKIYNLNLIGLSNLVALDIFENQITTLDLSSSLKIDHISGGKNPLEAIDLSQLPNIKELWLGFTSLHSLDLSNSTQLIGFNVSSCPNLETIILKNGSTENLNYFESELLSFYETDCSNFSSCPNLKYICGDESELESISQKIASYNYTNCNVGGYCSFQAGGINYTIQGNNRYDEKNNGCDVNDFNFSNLKFNFSDGINSGNLISNSTGNYSIPVQAGTYTITIKLENSSYFNISPSTVNVTFPAQPSPFTQNFCITPNGVHPDLEISILPLNTARSGFDSRYKIIYKNKGNITQSGTVNLDFNDAVLDVVLANPVVTTQTLNNLSWSFTNLLPFETREIAVALNVNSPMETPAVNGGDVLKYTATITGGSIDDMPNNNTFTLNQTVVNSFDPNDKTCLEGNTITPDLIGQYVHYMIRFENNGTANAQNIVVKDMIDLSKFDVSTLIPTSASHSYVTNIKAGNKVEFIFENISLPFDDANNDGYIAFKIKTLPTLVTGNTFTNEASIYFDYNFPIVTNKAATLIQTALSVQDFEFSNYFSLYPNPVLDVLNITSKDNIEVKSIAIYNTVGQLVLVIPNAQNVSKVDVSNLTTGNYFIKINSDKGTSNTKFIKN